MRIPELLENGERVMCACGDEKCYKAIEMNWTQLVVYLDVSDIREEFTVFEFPDNVGVVRYTDKDVPKPDWEDAPEWANWWVVDVDGRVLWSVDEPHPKNLGDWVTTVDWNDSLYWGKETVFVVIPLGIDWRQLKESRENR
jgi:hypothetical protein